MITSTLSTPEYKYEYEYDTLLNPEYKYEYEYEYIDKT